MAANTPLLVLHPLYDNPRHPPQTMKGVYSGIKGVGMEILLRVPDEIKIIIIDKCPLGLKILLEKLVFNSESVLDDYLGECLIEKLNWDQKKDLLVSMFLRRHGDLYEEMYLKNNQEIQREYQEVYLQLQYMEHLHFLYNYY